MNTMTDEQAMAVLDGAAARFERQRPFPCTATASDLRAARAHLSSVVGERNSLKSVLSRIASSREGLMLLGRIASDEMDKLDHLFDMGSSRRTTNG